METFSFTNECRIYGNIYIHVISLGRLTAEITEPQILNWLEIKITGGNQQFCQKCGPDPKMKTITVVDESCQNKLLYSTEDFRARLQTVSSLKSIIGRDLHVNL